MHPLGCTDLLYSTWEGTLLCLRHVRSIVCGLTAFKCARSLLLSTCLGLAAHMQLYGQYCAIILPWLLVWVCLCSTARVNLFLMGKSRDMDTLSRTSEIIEYKMKNILMTFFFFFFKIIETWHTVMWWFSICTKSCIFQHGSVLEDSLLWSVGD